MDTQKLLNKISIEERIPFFLQKSKNITCKFKCLAFHSNFKPMYCQRIGVSFNSISFENFYCSGICKYNPVKKYVNKLDFLFYMS